MFPDFSYYKQQMKRMSDLLPTIEDLNYDFCNDVTAKLGPILPMYVRLLSRF